MGTLTGETPALPEHCDHKLPTSCRLTASAKCCACQDVRPHSGLYTTYVDGVGLVQRGTRWQRYCYFCMVFWENRVAATEPPIQPRNTKVPEVPDQKPFIDRWFDYHRKDVACEIPWRDVDPGMLPVLNAAERRLALRSSQAPTPADSNHVVSLDATLDDLLEAANNEQQGSQSETGDQATASSSTNTEIQISTVSESDRDAALLVEALNRRNDAETRYRSAQMRRQRATCELTAAETELDTRQAQKLQAQQDHRIIQSRQEHRESQLLVRMMDSTNETNQRTAAQVLARVFGTREEVERQGADYVSPLTSMFTRAYERYRVAEEVRAEERASTENSDRHREIITSLARQQYPQLFHAIQERIERDIAAEGQLKTLDDEEDQRPPPKSEEQMTVKLVCKVCLQQTADTAVLPCGHLVMCSYCADICVPVRPSDQTRPIGKAKCPLCQKRVKRRARIFAS